MHLGMCKFSIFQEINILINKSVHVARCGLTLAVNDKDKNKVETERISSETSLSNVNLNSDFRINRWVQCDLVRLFFLFK